MNCAHFPQKQRKKDNKSYKNLPSLIQNSPKLSGSFKARPFAEGSIINFIPYFLKTNSNGITPHGAKLFCHQFREFALERRRVPVEPFQGEVGAAENDDNGFAFDVEALYLARRFGYKISEVPIMWSEGRDSKINLFRDPFLMLNDLLKIKKLHNRASA